MKRTFGMFLSYVLVAAMASVLTLLVSGFAGGESKLDELSDLIEKYYIDEVDMTMMEDAAAKAMVKAAGDRWSYYIPADEYSVHMEDVKNAYVGIGITITVAHDGSGLQVMEVDPGSPAEEAGILVDDVITAIEGQSTADMTTTEARDLVRGKEGTKVAITIWRQGQTLTVPVTRQKIQVTVASGQMLENGIGLVTIENFDERCAKESIASIEALLAQGAQKLIFDVRGNPGGYVREMVKLLDYLLPEGDLFRMVDYAGNEAVDTSDKRCMNIPMAVLVNGSSYSAAEFFAVVLQEYDAATVVGEKTTGKGYCQNTFRLKDGSAVALSTGKYVTPNGISLEGVGITPDVPVPVDSDTALKIAYGQLEPMQDPQILAAMDALK